MVPGPESKSRRVFPICISKEHELRCRDGTQVPEPRMVTFIPDLIDFTAVTFEGLINYKRKKLLVICYWLIETNDGLKSATLK